MPKGSCRPLAASLHIFGRDGIGLARPDGEPKWSSASRSGMRSPSSTLPPEMTTAQHCSIVAAPKPTAPLYISINVTAPGQHHRSCKYDGPTRRAQRPVYLVGGADVYGSCTTKPRQRFVFGSTPKHGVQDASAGQAGRPTNSRRRTSSSPAVFSPTSFRICSASGPTATAIGAGVRSAASMT